MYKSFDYVLVGAGFFCSVIAERIANDMNKKVLIIEKRDHIGGNCYSEIDHKTGIEYHKYGTHIFHTSDKEVWDYLSKYTSFNSYYHQVLTIYNGQVYQMPINLETINAFYKINLKPYEVDAFLKKEIEAEHYVEPKNFEDGYTEIFNKLLASKNITLQLDTDFHQIKNEFSPDAKIIYSGSIDSLLDYKYGALDYRTLSFEKQVLDYEDYQGTSVMNYANQEIPYTRIHEPKHLHPERHYPSGKTLIIKEFSEEANREEPYYPIGGEKNRLLYNRYLEEIQETYPNVIVGGRLGDYKYYDMHHVIREALNVYDKHILG